MIICKAIFVKSASKLEKCPHTDRPEFAFIGRSNVGKSSLINTLANNGTLSKTSIKPWKTQLMNFFLINDERYLVDLPWYGYASSGAKDRAYRIDATHDYFIGRSSLKRVFVLVDGSILPQKIDLEFMNALAEEWIRFDIVMTKIDKATQKDLAQHERLLKEKLCTIVDHLPKIFPLSNISKRWRERLLDYIQDLMW